jgi:hypothetical protein
VLGIGTTIAFAAATITAPAPVQALALDTPVLAYASLNSSADCGRVRVRSRATGRTVRLGRLRACEHTSTGSGIDALSIASNRVLWLYFTGGNFRDWSLFTATTTAPRPRRLRFVSREVAEFPPIVIGEGDTTRYGDLLPYAVDREVVVLRPNGTRAFAWTAPGPVAALGANWGSVAIALRDGRIFVLEDGAVRRSWTAGRSPYAVFVTGNGIATQYERAVELRTGSSTRQWPIPLHARLRDAEGLRAVYLAAGRAWLLDLSTGARRALGPATDVQLEGTTVAIASGRAIRLVRAG